MVAFRDVDKKAGDVLRVGYCHDKPWQVAVSHSGDNPKFSAFGTVSNNNILDAAPSIRYTTNGLTVDAKAGSTGNSVIDMKYDFPKSCASSTSCKALPLLSGISLGSRLERKFVKNVVTDSTVLSADYRKDILQGRVTFNPYSMGWTVSKCLAYDKLPGNSMFMIGGEANGGGKDPTTFSYTIGAGYSRGGPKPWAVSLKASPHESTPMGKLSASIFAASDKGHALAAEVSHTIPTNKSAVTLGGLMYLSSKRDTWVKAKLQPDAKVATVLCHKFSDNLTGSFGCQFSAVKQDAECLSYGMKLGMTV